VFDYPTNTITLYGKNGDPVISADAYNKITSDAQGHFPVGRYDYDYYKPHAPGGEDTAYGLNGIFIFRVPGREGLGVHSGRKFHQPPGPKHPTQGCIRTSDAFTEAVHDLHCGDDPLTHILVFSEVDYATYE
jgi:hypothetical protein